MRPSVHALLRSLAPLPTPVWEFGSYRWDGGPVVADSLGQAVTGADQLSGDGVDRIENLHQLSMGAGTIGTALLLDTIEHVARPWQALREVARVLDPDRGVVVVTSHFLFPIHECPHDFWRFTAAGMAELLAPFSSTLACTAGLAAMPHTVVGLGFRGAPDLRLMEAVEAWTHGAATTWRERTLAMLPPLVVGGLYRRYRAWRRRGLCR